MVFDFVVSLVEVDEGEGVDASTKIPIVGERERGGEREGDCRLFACIWFGQRNKQREEKKNRRNRSRLTLLWFTFSSANNTSTQDDKWSENPKKWKSEQ